MRIRSSSPKPKPKPTPVERTDQTLKRETSRHEDFHAADLVQEVPHEQEHRGVVTYLAGFIEGEEHLLDLFPPKERRTYRQAIKDAFTHGWSRLSHLQSPERKAEPARDLLNSHRKKEQKLTPEESHTVVGVLDTITEVMKEVGLEIPASLDAFAESLDNDELRTALIRHCEQHLNGIDASDNVKAALTVARSIVDQIRQHFEVYVLDQDALSRCGSDFSGLPASLRIVLQDPKVGEKTLEEVKTGEAVISSQVLRRTPEHLLDGFREVSRVITGGSFLWLDPYVRTGRRPAISGRDISRTRQVLSSTADGLERFFRKTVKKINLEGEQERLTVALEHIDIAEVADRLDSIAHLVTDENKAHDLEMLAELGHLTAACRAQDPEELVFDLTEPNLSAFDRFRSQAVRVRVHHRGSARASGIVGGIERLYRLREYRQAILQHTVVADYASQASEAAKEIVSGVAVMSIAGMFLKKYLSQGAAHSVIVFEDIMGWLADVKAQRGQGVPLERILLGKRNIGLPVSLVAAVAAAHETHHVVESGMEAAGPIGGGMLAFAATILSLYTTGASWVMFRSIADEMIKEGKIDRPGDREAARQFLKIVAHAAGTQSAEDQLYDHLTAAFDDIEAHYQGLPDGWSLAHTLAEQHPDTSVETLAAVREAQDHVISLLNSDDLENSLQDVMEDIASYWFACFEQAGVTLSDAQKKELASNLHALEGSTESDPKKVTRAIADMLLPIVEEHPDPQAKKIVHEILEAVEQMVSPEQGHSSFLSRFAHDQIFANPVRKRLVQGAVAPWAVGILIGLTAPELLAFPMVFAGIGSLQTASAVAMIHLQNRHHRKELAELGEQFADPMAAARSRQQEPLQSAMWQPARPEA